MVINKGNFVQMDTPEKIYNKPKSKFVAKLLGEVNEMHENSNHLGQVKTPFGLVNCNKHINRSISCKNKKHCCIFRPEDITLGKVGIKGIVKEKYFLGSYWEYSILLEDKKKILKVTSCKESYLKNQNVSLSIDLENILIFQE